MQFTIQPIDYVGESYLDSGNYTFEVGSEDISSSTYPLTFNLVKD